jgi:hypothetical protein
MSDRHLTRKLRVPFPWVAYISQPLDRPDVKLILNPIKFQSLYHRWLLENCVRKNPRSRSLFD